MGNPEESDRVRLSKRVAAQQPCSRSEAERLIVGGLVRVDGVVVVLPQTRVSAQQVVTVDAAERVEANEPVTLLWHKPAGVVLSEGMHLPDAEAQRWLTDDRRSPHDRSRVLLLRAHQHRLSPLLPLLAGASGLMVLTQSAGVVRRLTEMSADLEHEWLLDMAWPAEEAGADVREAAVRSLSMPVTFDGRQLAAARASWQSERRLRVAIKGCLPGQIEFLLERAGLKTEVLRRQRLGRIALTGLDAGQWRYLLPTERF